MKSLTVLLVACLLTACQHRSIEPLPKCGSLVMSGTHAGGEIPPHHVTTNCTR